MCLLSLLLCVALYHLYASVTGSLSKKDLLSDLYFEVSAKPLDTCGIPYIIPDSTVVSMFVSFP